MRTDVLLHRSSCSRAPDRFTNSDGFFPVLPAQSCLKTWLGKPENVKAAQEALKARARANSLANLVKYKAGMEKSLDKAGTFEAGYKY